MKKNTNSYTKTISLKIQMNDDDKRILRGAQNDYSCATRFAIQRIFEQKDIKNNDLIHLVNEKFGYLDSHLINSSCQLARQMHDAEVERKKYLDKQQQNYFEKTGKRDKFIYKTMIFGTRKLFELKAKNEISKEEWQLARLLPLYSIGEACKSANRKMNFDLENQSVTLKLDKNTHITATFKAQNKNRTKELEIIQDLIINKEMPVSFRITGNQLDLMIDVDKTNKEKVKVIDSRYAAVDLNPNGIGFVIYDGKERIYEKIYNIKELTKSTGKSFNDTKTVYMFNKKNYETVMIVKQITNLLRHYQVSKFGVEELEFEMGDQGKGSAYNKLVKNVWNYSEITDQLKKRCVANGIAFKLVRPQYSSFIGNLIHQLPDPVSAACELARRTNEPGSIFPELIDLQLIANRWKEQAINLNVMICQSWQELHRLYKFSNLRYRVETHPIEEFRKAFSYKSKVVVF